MELEWAWCESREELFVIKADSNYLAYAPLRHTSFQITPAAYLSLKHGDRAIKSALVKRLQDKPLIELSRIPPDDKFCPDRVDLAITTRCPLQCIYCHANSNDVLLDMEKTTAQKAIYHTLVSTKEKGSEFAHIGFNGGGEPTSRFDFMREIISFARMQAKLLDVEVRFGMATNGYFSDDICEYIAYNFHQLAVSLDGPRTIHDAQRPTISGVGSYDVVFRNAKKLHNSNIKHFFIRSTLSRTGVSQLHDIVTFFQAEFPKAGYSFMPLNRLGRGATCGIDSPSPIEYIDAFADLLLNKRICDLGKVYFMCGYITEVRTTFCDAFSRPGFNVTVQGMVAA